MDRESQKRIVEALVLGAPEPVSAQKIADVVPGLEADDARALVAELEREYEEQGRAFEVWEVAGGYQLRTRPEYASYLRLLHRERPLRLSRAALETLALVAYRQPLTRPEIEDLRGVDCGAVLKSLLERDLVRIVGRRDAPGRPALFGTTSTFLETFSLKGLSDLPPLRETEALIAAPAESTDEVVNALAQGAETDGLAGDEPGDDELGPDDDGEPELEAKLH
jgi:segregation and condensation protein B